MTLDQLQSDYLKQTLKFLDQQRLMQPSLNPQVGFDFQGLRRSYKDNATHPDAKFVARFGRIWIYDVALGIYADLKSGRARQAGYQAGRAMQLALQEEEQGYRGLWHFSYNTVDDSFIDPRGPTGANAWCLNAHYAYMLSSGDKSGLAWANRAVKEYLFGQQVMDSADLRYGLIRAGIHNADDLARIESGMGYGVYTGDLNAQYEHVILEHCIDVAGTYRLAYRATQRFSPQEKAFLEELIHRHDLLIQGIRRGFLQKDHFVSAMDPQGKLYLGKDGSPSIAVDNNTWAAYVFMPYDLDAALSSARFVEQKFLVRTPPAHVEDLPATASSQDLEGLYYFTAGFEDPFVQVPADHRPKMEHLLHPEAAFGFVLFLKGVASLLPEGSQKESFKKRALELYQHTVSLQQMYGAGSFPYASANVGAVFSTLNSVTTAATGAITTAILQGAPNSDFIGVIPPREFTVAGKAPLVAADSASASA